jgi:hypothetical protein
MDFLTPSLYYFYRYADNRQLAGQYLAYALFQLEVNRAWTDKPLMPFVWMRIAGNKDKTSIDLQMAEATAIFPFFAGVRSMWLYEESAYLRDGLRKSDAVLLKFVKGLYRLSEYSEFFEGEYELIEQVSAWEYFRSDNIIWRGIRKGDKLLVAACKPQGVAGKKYLLRIEYEGLIEDIEIKGREVVLKTISLR